MSKSAGTTNALYVDPRQARLMGHQMGISGVNRQEKRLIASVARKSAKKDKEMLNVVFSDQCAAEALAERLLLSSPPDRGFAWGVVCHYDTNRYIVKLFSDSERSNYYRPVV